MDPRQPDRFEELLTRAFDGETSPDERAELASLADAEPRLAALAELRDALRAALAHPGPVDVAGEVMGLLAADEAWSLGDSLREAVGAPIDLADAVFDGLALDAAWAPIGAAIAEAVSEPVDVTEDVMAGLDEAAWAPIGAALADAVSRPVDVWSGVADAIGADRAAVHGWDAAPLRAAFAAIPAVDVADAVMATVAVEARVVAPSRMTAPRMPLWASLGGPVLAFAAAAALLFAVMPRAPSGAPGGPLARQPSVQFAAINDAQVEEVSAAQDVVVQVMQFEEGGVTFILVDDSSGPGVPL